MDQDDIARPAWQADAACRGVGAALFFPERGTDVRARVPEAKAICAGCPVRQECLEYALCLPFPQSRYGIWGGLTEKERRQVRQERQVAAQEDAA
jgi:WhiB family redox-sensing transcriptional regulator